MNEPLTANDHWSPIVFSSGMHWFIGMATKEAIDSPAEVTHWILKDVHMVLMNKVMIPNKLAPSQPKVVEQLSIVPPPIASIAGGAVKEFKVLNMNWFFEPTEDQLTPVRARIKQDEQDQTPAVG